MTWETMRRWLWQARARGQVLILFAVALVGMVGMTGLAIDLGYTFSQKRAIQNAADAGALAGAQYLTKSTPDVRLPVRNEVAQVVSQNGFGGATPQLVSCQYVDALDNALGDCSQEPPDEATGVEVRVRETHRTFFIQIVPGAPDTASTEAMARARVFKVTNAPGDAPFIVCGYDTELADGGTLSILKPGTSEIDPEAIGKTFRIHAPQGISRCGTGNAFKGLVGDNDEENIPIPGIWEGTPGTRASVRIKVPGLRGCRPGSSVNDCILLLPIADSGEGNGSHVKFHVVAVAAFWIQECHANCHEGTLIGQYVIGPGDGWLPDPGDTWQLGDNGLIMIRLVA